jgi:N4-gp56 family major capsid protein
MTAFNSRLRFAAILFFAIVFALHGPGAFFLYLFLMGLAFGHPLAQMARGMLGAAVTTANPADFADRQQTLLNRKLLKSLQFSLALARYAQTDGYSPNGRAIRFFRPRKANLVGINAEAVTAFTRTIVPLNATTALTEGSDAGIAYTEVGLGYVDIYQGQRLGAAIITDIVQAIDLIKTTSQYSTTMGEDAALDYDRVCRDSLIDALFNSNNGYLAGVDGGYFERFAGVQNTGVSADDFATLVGTSKQNGRITRGVALGCVTQLADAKIPTIGGNYVAITSPRVTHDIRQDELWLRAATFKGDPLYKDLDLMLDGVAYVKAHNPWVEDQVYGTEDVTPATADGLIYSTIYLGKDAFGAPKLSNAVAGQSPVAPRVTILDKPDKSDIANRKTVLSWKAYYGAGPFICKTETGGAANAIGERPRYIVLRSRSTFI